MAPHADEAHDLDTAAPEQKCLGLSQVRRCEDLNGHSLSNGHSNGYSNGNGCSNGHGRLNGHYTNGHHNGNGVHCTNGNGARTSNGNSVHNGNNNDQGIDSETASIASNWDAATVVDMPVPRNLPRPGDYIEFPQLKHKQGAPLNRWSHFMTRDNDSPGAQSMLYSQIQNWEKTKNAPQVGIATVWWEGNPCNSHLRELGDLVRKAVWEEGMIGWQYGTIGVSDGITMGSEGMRFSLQSRELIADNIETITCAQRHDANISIPGCDKNMPGVVIAAARHNRPFLMIYGGTIRKGYSELAGKEINITTCYEARGALASGNLKPCEEHKNATPEQVLEDIKTHSCPGPGACGGMYTANTMAVAIEAMGLTLPGSSSHPAKSPEKMRECERAASTIKMLMEKDIRARDLMTRAAFENAVKITILMGGSTNAVLHLLAMASSADVPLTLEDIDAISQRTPLLANMKPFGDYLMEDLNKIGGTPSVLKFLIQAGYIDGSILTVTGKTLWENVADKPSLEFGPDKQAIIRPLHDPIKTSGHIRVLKGNLAPGGAVAKITGKEGEEFIGSARCFDKEHELDRALRTDMKLRTTKENIVLIVRYEGPKGGPGMPEQLNASAFLQGADMANFALVTDGRYSGASHGFIVGHVVPEAVVGGPIALVKDGDVIKIDAVENRIDIIEIPGVGKGEEVVRRELEKRRREWKRPPVRPLRGTLAKYARLVGDASHGAVTDLPVKSESLEW